ncbi:hypothetical protein GGR57DRAFT_510865, partial [Xylariaceae sp. FL1272]
AVINRSLTLSEIKDFVCPEPRVDLRSLVRKCSCFLQVGNDANVSFHHWSIRDYVMKQIRPFVEYHDTQNRIPTVDICSSLVTIGLNSLAESLSGDDNHHPNSTSALILGWAEFLFHMIRELPKEQSREVFTQNIVCRTIDKVVEFLRQYFLVWFEVLGAEKLLERASILLRNVNLLIDGKDSTLIHRIAELRNAQCIIHLHLSAETSAQFPITNTMLFFSGAERWREKNYGDQTYQMKILHSGDGWAHDFGSLKGYNNWVRCVDFSLDGRLIASGSDDGSVRIWDAATGTTQHMLAMESNWVYCVAFSSRGHVAAGTDEGHVIIWDSSLVYELFRQERTIDGVSIS